MLSFMKCSVRYSSRMAGAASRDRGPPNIVVFHRSLSEKEGAEVLQFTNALRYAGVDADCSFYHLHDSPFDWDQWQLDKIRDCDRIVLIDSPGLFVASDPPRGFPQSDQLFLRISTRRHERVVRIALNNPTMEPTMDPSVVSELLRPYQAFSVTTRIHKEKGIPVLTAVSQPEFYVNMMGYSSPAAEFSTGRLSD